MVLSLTKHHAEGPGRFRRVPLLEIDEGMDMLQWLENLSPLSGLNTFSTAMAVQGVILVNSKKDTNQKKQLKYKEINLCDS